MAAGRRAIEQIHHIGIMECRRSASGGMEKWINGFLLLGIKIEYGHDHDNSLDINAAFIKMCKKETDSMRLKKILIAIGVFIVVLIAGIYVFLERG